MELKFVQTEMRLKGSDFKYSFKNYTCVFLTDVMYLKNVKILQRSLG